MNHTCTLGEVERVVERAMLIYSSLGLSGYRYYLREGILHDLEAEAARLTHSARELKLSPKCEGHAKAMEYRAIRIRKDVSKLKKGLTRTIEILNNAYLNNLPAISAKFQRLLDLLGEKRQRFINKEMRLLIFVERVVMTNPLVDMLNTHFDLKTGMYCY